MPVILTQPAAEAGGGLAHPGPALGLWAEGPARPQSACRPMVRVSRRCRTSETRTPHPARLFPARGPAVNTCSHPGRYFFSSSIQSSPAAWSIAGCVGGSRRPGQARPTASPGVPHRRLARGPPSSLRTRPSGESSGDREPGPRPGQARGLDVPGWLSPRKPSRCRADSRVTPRALDPLPPAAILLAPAGLIMLLPLRGQDHSEKPLLKNSANRRLQRPQSQSFPNERITHLSKSARNSPKHSSPDPHQTPISNKKPETW